MRIVPEPDIPPCFRNNNEDCVEEVNKSDDDSMNGSVNVLQNVTYDVLLDELNQDAVIPNIDANQNPHAVLEPTVLEPTELVEMEENVNEEEIEQVAPETYNDRLAAARQKVRAEQSLITKKLLHKEEPL